MSKVRVVPVPVQTDEATDEIVPTAVGELTYILIAVAYAELQTPFVATTLNQVVWVKAPVLNVIAVLTADNVICSTASPTLE